jgi:hypothetical protein
MHDWHRRRLISAPGKQPGCQALMHEAVRTYMRPRRVVVVHSCSPEGGSTGRPPVCRVPRVVIHRSGRACRGDCSAPRGAPNARGVPEGRSPHGDVSTHRPRHRPAHRVEAAGAGSARLRTGVAMPRTWPRSGTVNLKRWWRQRDSSVFVSSTSWGSTSGWLAYAHMPGCGQPQFRAAKLPLVPGRATAPVPSVRSDATTMPASRSGDPLAAL